MENLFTITGFAAAVHRDRATITRALRGIKPTQQRDGRSHYALHVIFDAMLKYQQRGGTSRKPDGKPSEQELLTKARREKIEQENRERRGRLVDFKVVEHVMKARDSLIREKA